MSKHKCPACGSGNTAYGLSEFSRNVALYCNECNFRDIVFYADTPIEAEAYWKATREPREEEESEIRVKTRGQMPKLRFVKYCDNHATRDAKLEFLQKLRQRMVGAGTVGCPQLGYSFVLNLAVGCKR